MHSISTCLLTSFFAISTAINATEIVEVRNENNLRLPYELSYKSDKSDKPVNIIKDDGSIDHASEKSYEYNNIRMQTFSIGPNKTYVFTNLVIPQEESSHHDISIAIQGLSGGSLKHIEFDNKTGEINILVSSANFQPNYGKLVPSEPTLIESYPAFAKARLIITNKGTIKIENASKN